MNPRRGRTGIGAPASAATSPAHVPAALITNGAPIAGSSAASVRTPVTSPPASRSIAVTDVPRWIVAPASRARRRSAAVASIGWTWASCGYQAPPATSRVRFGSSAARPAASTASTVTPAARCAAARSPSAPSVAACRATTTPPFGSYSSASSPSSSASARQRAADRRASVSSAPGALSETRMFPSPALVVPPAMPPRSTTATRSPAAVRAWAHAAPTMPAPMTTTSAVVGATPVSCHTALPARPLPDPLLEIARMAALVPSVDPRTGLVVEDVAPESTPDDVDAAVIAAQLAAPVLAALGATGRAAVLEGMADALEADREALVELADRETALGRPRLPGELTRTIYQLRFFADVIRDGAYLEAVIDPAHESPMGPLADVRRYLVPLGPVAVFGASNFPFAFSVAGGDTAAAIAAGCPVVAKAHSSHPALSAAVHRAIVRGAEAAGAPEGTIGLVFGREGGTALVTHPGIRAVAFTGSTAGGRALFDLASARPDPIPFYGELGSLNPLTVTPAAAAERAAAIAQGWVASFTLGTGQFCTKPGLALVPAGGDGDAFRDAASAAVAAVGPSTMLNGAMRDAYLEGTARIGSVGRRRARDAPARRGGRLRSWRRRWSRRRPTRCAPTGSPLLAECFGPVGVLARYRDEADLLDILGRMEGSLTASVHIGEGETDLPAQVLDAARAFAGRVLVNGFPTGVAVNWSMVHGGPWPASTNAAHTSVGATSIRRFLRPVAFQNVPDELLPPELRDANPLGIPRRTVPHA